MYCEKEFFRVDVRLPSVVQTQRRKAKMKNGENTPNINKRIKTCNGLLKTVNTCDIIKPNEGFISSIDTYQMEM